jgi:hypothetical protein
MSGRVCPIADVVKRGRPRRYFRMRRTGMQPSLRRGDESPFTAGAGIGGWGGPERTYIRGERANAPHSSDPPSIDRCDRANRARKLPPLCRLQRGSTFTATEVLARSFAVGGAIHGRM